MYNYIGFSFSAVYNRNETIGVYSPLNSFSILKTSKLSRCFLGNNKFTGCNCNRLGKACIDGSCPCVALNRECDPDLCTSCGALDRANPSIRHGAPNNETGCSNVVLQAGASKRLILGESQLDVFYGLYAGEPISRGAFIAEYVGELISFEESERRAIIYQEIGQSYLFDINVGRLSRNL